MGLGEKRRGEELYNDYRPTKPRFWQFSVFFLNRRARIFIECSSMKGQWRVMPNFYDFNQNLTITVERVLMDDLTVRKLRYAVL